MQISNLALISKKIVKTVAVLSISFATIASFSANAAPLVDKSTEIKLVKICHALKSNSRIKLHRIVKQSRLGYKQIAKGLVCNGKPAMEFAMVNNASKTADYLARKANVDARRMVAKR